MNYIIYNGINSNTLSGLIISELPPITKPKLRVQKTEIDGRDGDITDDLGYSAYDKELDIGLSRNFDIDKIINYFNGSGSFIFSNEPTKLYKGKIINQIDYTRLLKFKKAKVMIHVQPFKYLVDEIPTSLTITSETSLKVVNNGLLKSKPVITLTGTGTVTISLNGNSEFTYTFPTADTYVTIDSDKMDAYVGETLKNRNMTGEFPTLLVGENTITWTGTLTKIEIDPKSRWL